MGDAPELNVQLQRVLTRIKATHLQISNTQKEILGLTISVADLEAKINQPGLTAEQRVTFQTAYDNDLTKRQEAQSRLSDEEAALASLVAEKKALMTQLLEATATGDLTPESLEQRSVQGSLISSIPLFDGSPGVDGEAWIRLVDRAKDQFGWTSRQTAQTARNRLTGDARMFVDNNEVEGLAGIDTWDEEPDNLRGMLIDKFGYTYSAATAAHALEDLKQATNETVDQFYERVRFAVSKFLADMEKTGPHEATYRNMFQRLTFTHFKGGIFSSYRQAIYNAASDRQPSTPRVLLEAARVVELEAGKSRKDVVFKKVAEIQATDEADQAFVASKEEAAAAAPIEKNEKKDEMEELRKEVEAINKKVQQQQQPQRGRGGPGRWRGGRWRGRGGRGQRGGGRGRGRGSCNGCGAHDHWWRECPQNPQRQWPQQQGGPAFNPYQQFGRGNGNPPNWPRGNNEIMFSDDGFFDPLGSGN